MLTLNEIERNVVECANVLGIDVELSLRRVQLVISAFGWEWIHTQSKRARGRGVPVMVRHPLVIAFENLEGPDLMGIIELGRYLGTFHDDPQIGAVIQGMRARSQYASSFFHLAMAYRFSAAGAEVVLEPESLRGRADFRIQYGPLSVLCECWRQEEASLPSALESLLERAARWGLDTVPKRFLVRITFSRIPTSDWEARLRQLVRKTLVDFCTSVSGIPEISMNEFCAVSVQEFPRGALTDFSRDALKANLPYATRTQVVSTLPLDSWKKHKKGEGLDLSEETRHHAIQICVPEEWNRGRSPPTPTIVRKLAQAKSLATDTGRLLCAESWPLGEPFDPSRAETILGELSRVLESRPDVVAVVFAERHWYGNQGHKYNLYGRVNSESPFRLPLELWKKLFDNERQEVELL